VTLRWLRAVTGEYLKTLMTLQDEAAELMIAQ
jgi:hypothetical protein